MGFKSTGPNDTMPGMMEEIRKAIGPSSEIQELRKAVGPSPEMQELRKAMTPSQETIRALESYRKAMTPSQATIRALESLRKAMTPSQETIRALESFRKAMTPSQETIRALESFRKVVIPSQELLRASETFKAITAQFNDPLGLLGNKHLDRFVQTSNPLEATARGRTLRRLLSQETPELALVTASGSVLEEYGCDQTDTENLALSTIRALCSEELVAYDLDTRLKLLWSAYDKKLVPHLLIATFTLPTLVICFGYVTVGAAVYLPFAYQLLIATLEAYRALSGPLDDDEGPVV